MTSYGSPGSTPVQVPGWPPKGQLPQLHSCRSCPAFSGLRLGVQSPGLKV